MSSISIVIFPSGSINHDMTRVEVQLNCDVKEQTNIFIPSQSERTL